MKTNRVNIFQYKSDLESVPILKKDFTMSFDPASKSYFSIYAAILFFGSLFCLLLALAYSSISEVIDVDSWEQVKWEQVKAEVVRVEIEERYTKSQGTYYSIKPLFSFRLIDGTMHSAKFENLSFREAEDYGAASESVKVGQIFDISYNPKNPDHIRDPGRGSSADIGMSIGFFVMAIISFVKLVDSIQLLKEKRASS